MRTQTKLLAAVALGSAVLSVSMAARAESVSLGLPVEEVTVGTFDEGYQVGQRNGTLIAERLYKRTIGNENKGCGALGEFQSAVNLVVARIRPAPGRSTRFTAGFFQGYI